MDNHIRFSLVSSRVEESLAMMKSYVDGQMKFYMNPDALIGIVSSMIEQVTGSENAEYRAYLDYLFSELKPLVKLFHAKEMVAIIQLCIEGNAHAFRNHDVIGMAEEAIRKAKDVGNDVTELEVHFSLLKKKMENH